MSRHMTPELQAAFMSEAQKLLGEIGPIVACLDEATIEALKLASRRSHNMIGAAALLGLTTLSHVARIQEEILESLWAKKRRLTDEVKHLIDATFQATVMCIHSPHSTPQDNVGVLASIVIPYRRLKQLPMEGDEAAIRKLLPKAVAKVIHAAPVVAMPKSKTNAERTNPNRSSQSRQSVGASHVNATNANATHANAINRNSDVHNSHILNSDILNFDILNSGILNSGVLNSGVLNSDIMNSDILNSGVLDYGTQNSGVPNSDNAIGSNTSKVVDEAVVLRAEVIQWLDAMDAVDADYAGIYANVAEVSLRNLRGLLEALVAEPDHFENLLGLHRNMQKLKVASATVGFVAVSKLAHRAENALQIISDSKSALSPGMISLLHLVIDTMDDLAARKFETDAMAQRLNELLMRLDNPGAPTPLVTTVEPATSEPPVIAVKVTETQAVDLVAEITDTTAVKPTGKTDRNPVERRDALDQLVTELNVVRTSFEQRMERLNTEQNELQLGLERVQEMATTFGLDFENETDSDRNAMPLETACEDMPSRLHAKSLDDLLQSLDLPNQNGEGNSPRLTSSARPTHGIESCRAR